MYVQWHSGIFFSYKAYVKNYGLTPIAGTTHVCNNLINITSTHSS
jgi:hypothetical protein